MSRFTADRRYNPQEVLRILRVDEDSDEEDFDEPEPSIREIDKEFDIEQDVVQEESSSENDVPTSPNREKIVSRDGTIWAPEFPTQNGRASKRNIIKTRPGTKQFILARVDNAKDVFQELWGHRNIEHIMEFTIAEARRQGDSEFSLRKEELDAFFGLCLLRGVLKGRDEPLTNFWDLEYGRPMFSETMGRSKFQSIIRYIRFDDKTSRQRRRQSDKFAAIRDLWNAVMDNCQKSYFPHSHVTVDEQLFPCRSR